MKLLITGASGFVGKHLVKALVKTNHQLALLLRNSDSKLSFNGFISSRVSFVLLVDKKWKSQLNAYAPDVVIHLASHLTSSDDEPAIDNLIESNILLGTHLLDALKSVPIKYFINTGSFAEYYNNSSTTDPAYLYAATKTAFRSILQYYKDIIHFKTINVIPYTIYGAVDSQKKLVDHIYDSIDASIPKKMSPGEQILDFIHIEDVVDFYLSLLSNLDKIEKEYTEIHLGTGIGTTPRQVADVIKGITGKDVNIEWGGMPYRKRDTMLAVANRNQPSELFNWHPKKSIYNGLKEYINLLE